MKVCTKTLLQSVQQPSHSSVFNFWEPLHYLDKGYGFQTWEVSPQYAIRSWAYIIIHLLPARLAAFLIGTDKVNVYHLLVFLKIMYPSQRIPFFAVRIFLALISTLTEAAFYRAVHQKINERVGRYLFFMMLFSAGMWNASTGQFLVPSTIKDVQMLLLYSISPFLLCNVCRDSGVCICSPPFLHGR